MRNCPWRNSPKRGALRRKLQSIKTVGLRRSWLPCGCIGACVGRRSCLRSQKRTARSSTSSAAPSVRRVSPAKTRAARSWRAGTRFLLYLVIAASIDAKWPHRRQKRHLQRLNPAGRRRRFKAQPSRHCADDPPPCLWTVVGAAINGLYGLSVACLARSAQRFQPPHATTSQSAPGVQPT